jgi:hypothetical protein
MNIKSGIMLLVLAVLVAIGGWYLFTHSASLPKTLNENGDRQFKEETDYYTIQAIYPNTTRLGTRTDSTPGADQKAVQKMESFVSQTVAAFKRDVSGMLTEDEKARIKESGFKYALGISYHAYNSGDYASFEFDLYQDTGGAHPNGFYQTFVFDLKGDEVALGDLFKPNSGYLERIASIARTQVEKRLTELAGEDATSTIFAEGLAPDVANYSNWIDNNGMLVFFIPPYQAAAYAAGSFEVHIPIDELADVIKPEVQ